MRKIILLLILLIPMIVFGKGEPMKFGKISPEELNMKYYENDSTAPAVILCNYGYFDGKDMQFIHQIRLKVLKEEGKAFANFYVPGAEKTNVNGITVNMVDGKKEITKLSSKSVFIEKITKNQYMVRVAMPNVKVGSVIDLEFYYYGLPNVWSFQETIPVKHSEISIERNDYLSFKKNYVGYIPLIQKNDYTWYVENAPAFKSEPFISSKKNFMTSFDIEIMRIHIPGYLYKDFTSSWDDVAKTLNEDSEFGEKVNHHERAYFINGLKNEIAEQTDSLYERMQLAFIKLKDYKWNKRESIFLTTSSLELTYKKKTGSVADINLTLIILLRKLGLKAYPVILSTRDNGIIPSYSTSINKFNYVVAHVYIGEKEYFLDATEENLPLGALPERALNGKGLEIFENDLYNWIDLVPIAKDKKFCMYNVNLSSSGKFKGTKTEINTGYYALNRRDKIKSFSSNEEYLSNRESSMTYSIEDYSVKGLDSLDCSLNEKFSIEGDQTVQKVGNQLLLDIMRSDRIESNPFKMESRKYPIDFVKSFEEKYLFNIDIPENYSVKQLPANSRITLQGKSASMLINSMVTENRIQVMYTFEINKPLFFQSEYENLKAFFDELMRKENEMIILEKNNAI